ncbi:MAG TPA: hypothetical protein VFP58_11680, partial [Candidatus Eisenbacteria bacterium]|nr:hypothetical protein [Candidatus Eisenbacteria bacterium]
TPLAHADLEREIAADARDLTLESLASRVRVLEEIAESVRSNVTAAYAVASAQLRMGLGLERGAGPRSGAGAGAGWPRPAGAGR